MHEELGKRSLTLPRVGRSQLRHTATPTGMRLDGQTFLVTGSTDGIGQHTALKLAEAGATVLVHGRCAAVLIT